MNKLQLTASFLISLFFLFSCHEYQPANTKKLQNKSPITIVVLGSSTAEGAGPCCLDSAWAYMYKAYLKELNPKSRLINLARGGYVTYKVMPDGQISPTKRWKSDSLRNITRALSYQPDAIIVNLPSNDVTRKVPVNEQLNNLDSLFAIAEKAHVPLWICTTQPITSLKKRREKQIVVKDYISNTYGKYAIDFWSGLAEEDGRIKPIYNAGDGIHLNSLAHKILFERVKEKEIHLIY